MTASFIAGIIALALAATSDARAQSFTGGLRGAARDANGVLPGVTVTLINDATNQTRLGVTNAAGEYSFAAVPPGIYTITASLAGFRTYENRGLHIGAQQILTLDVLLQVGQLQETITVNAETPVIDTSNASSGGVINSQQLATLPSGGRSPFLFAATVPTVVISGDAQFNRQQHRGTLQTGHPRRRGPASLRRSAGNDGGMMSTIWRVALPPPRTSNPQSSRRTMRGGKVTRAGARPSASSVSSLATIRTLVRGGK